MSRWNLFPAASRSASASTSTISRRKASSPKRASTRRRQLRAELLEERRVMDASGLLDGNLFQNPVSNSDVNGDQFVTASDALVVINELARQPDSSLESRLPSSNAFVDVNGDNQATALDALQVINELSRQTDPGEGVEDFAELLSSAEGEDFTPIAGVSRLRVQVENLSEIDGLFNTPVWVGFHDGGFDLGQLGESVASGSGLESLAEEGDLTEIRARFALESSGVDGAVLAPDGFAGAPVFDPAESASAEFDLTDTTDQQYFSFASMIIPTNDAFFGNLAQRQFEIFNDAGDFLGPRTITIYGSDIFDAGTEVNDPFGGAAFSTEGGNSVDQNGVITRLDEVNDFIGTGLPNGTTLGRAFTANTPIARITISPAENPSSPADDAGPRGQIASDSTVINSARTTLDVAAILSDASGIDGASIDPADVRLLRLTGGNRELLAAESVSVDTEVGFVRNNVEANYTFTSEDGIWDTADNGTYRLYLLNDAVSDTAGNGNAFVSLGDIEVAIGDGPVELAVQVENLSPANGLFQTPFWVATHDGSFEVASLGQSADGFGGLELIAEEGDASELAQRFASESNGTDGLIVSPGGFAGAPVFDPGETASLLLSIDQPINTPFFSFASMIIPSNDAFLANLDAEAYRLFDETGQFAGPITITLYGSDIWDAGTEANLTSGGPAFSTEGGDSVDEGGVIRLHAGLDDFIGTGLPTGGTLGSAFNSQTPIARITINLAGESLDPIDERGPNTSATVDDVTAETNSVTLDVTYVDASGVDTSTITPDSISLVDSEGNILTPTSVELIPNDQIDPRTVTARYTVDGPAGSWTSADNGDYRIEIGSTAVTDTLGNATANEPLGNLTVAIAVESAEVTVSVENLSPVGGLFQTPFWVGLHDGGFDLGTLGESASGFGGLEDLAEEGDASGVVSRFAAESTGADTVITSPGGFAGAPVFDPGEVASANLTITNPGVNQFFSFASMIIPSNDAFLANLNAQAYQLFDSLGQFNGPITIDVFGSDVWDAGTEVNNPSGGAAFSALGGTPTDEGGVITSLSNLDNFIGTDTAAGTTITSVFSSQTPIARITINLAGESTAPIDTNSPMSEVVVDDVIAATTSQTVTVTYVDPSGVDVATIDTSDLVLVSNDGRVALQASSVTTNATGSPRTVTATYTFDVAIDASDNGGFDVVSIDGEVADTLGNSLPSEVVGSFDVNVPTSSQSLRIFVENLSTDDGLYLTPFFTSIHDGNFELGQLGESSDGFGGLEEIAEEGSTQGLLDRFAETGGGVATVITAPNGFAGAPVFDPGDAASSNLSVVNPVRNRFFSFASMVIPSNDAFFANLNATAYELFDQSGAFNGPITINLYGNDVWDAGTEVNLAEGGAAFSALGGDSIDELGVIAPHAGLDNFVNTPLPTGSDLLFAELGRTPLARITISLSSSATDPIDLDAPEAFLNADPLSPTEGGLSLIVEYVDPSGIDLSTITESDLLLVREGDSLLSGIRVTSVSTQFTGDGSAPRLVRATYALESDNGDLEPGNYRVLQLQGETADLLGNANEFRVLGTFRV